MSPLQKAIAFDEHLYYFTAPDALLPILMVNELKKIREANEEKGGRSKSAHPLMKDWEARRDQWSVSC